MRTLIKWLRGWTVVKVITKVDLVGDGFRIEEWEYRLDRTRPGPMLWAPRARRHTELPTP